MKVFYRDLKAVDRNRSGSDKRHDRLELESDLDGVEGKEMMRPMSHRYSNRSRKLALSTNDSFVCINEIDNEKSVT